MQLFSLLKLVGKLCLGITVFICVWFCGTMINVGIDEFRAPAVVIGEITVPKLWPIHVGIGVTFLAVVSYYALVGFYSKHGKQW